jgi:hypothetical protein
MTHRAKSTWWWAAAFGCFASLSDAADDKPIGAWPSVEVLDLACARREVVACQRATMPDDIASALENTFGSNCFAGESPRRPVPCAFRFGQAKPAVCAGGHTLTFPVLSSNYRGRLVKVLTSCLKDGAVTRGYSITPYDHKGQRLGIAPIQVAPDQCALGAFMGGTEANDPFQKCTEHALTAASATDVEHSMQSSAQSVKDTTSSIEASVARRLAAFEQCLDDAASSGKPKPRASCANQ